MGAAKGWMEIVDDFGCRKFTVTSIADGCYYFKEKTLLEDRKLRYNEKEGRIEEYLPETGSWDVYSQYIYQVDFLKNQ